MTQDNRVAFKQSLVSRTIWAWQDAPVRGSGERPSWRSVAVGFLVGMGIALFFYYRHRTGIASGIAGVSTAMFFAAFLSPAIYLSINRVFRGLSHSVGLLFTWILLIPFFYVCASGIHLINRMFGKDPMRRSFNTMASSYWQEHRQEENMQQYRKQF